MADPTRIEGNFEGTRINQLNSMIPYGRQSISDADIEAVVEVLKSDFITQGPRVEEFEEALTSLTGAKYAICCSSGTAALYLAVRALHVGEGCTGLTVPLTFAASANCLELAGGRATFVDIDQGTLNIAVEAVEEYCNSFGPPDVVIAVDFAGIPSELEGLCDLKERFGFAIIEDAAHAIGSSYISRKGEQVQCGACVHSDMAIFSFHPVKNITCGEGGAILTNDPELARRLRLLREHGIERSGGWRYDFHEISFNFRLSDIHAALGISQLKRLESFKRKRRELFEWYREELSGLEEAGRLVLPQIPQGTDPCMHLFVIMMGERARVDRNTLYEQLRAQGVGVQVHYWPVHLFSYYKDRGYGPFENAEKVANTCLSLPLYPGLTDDDFLKVVTLIKEMV